jgi:hypothetical protein
LEHGPEEKLGLFGLAVGLTMFVMSSNTPDPQPMAGQKRKIMSVRHIK